jgi:hypothetical protein
MKKMNLKTNLKKQMKMKGNKIVGKIAKKAKTIRKKNEKWTTAIKRAAKLVKK